MILLHIKGVPKKVTFLIAWLSIRIQAGTLDRCWVQQFKKWLCFGTPCIVRLRSEQPFGLNFVFCLIISILFQINNCLTRWCLRDIGLDIPAPLMNNQRPKWVDGGSASSFKASEIRARPGWVVLQLLLKRTGRGQSASLCGHDLPIIQSAPSAYYCSGGPSLNITAAKVFEEIMRACYIYKRERKQESRHSTIWIYNCAMG